MIPCFQIDTSKTFLLAMFLIRLKTTLLQWSIRFFSLSKTPVHRMMVYERDGVTIKIKPSYTGLATIFDKDILLYLAGALMSAKNNGLAISKTIRFTTYDYIVSTNKALGGV
jgi:plasmid replication initiation protein